MDHSHSHVTTRTSQQAAVLDPDPEDAQVPAQDSSQWHPERRNAQRPRIELTAENDDMDESHLIRGYD